MITTRSGKSQVGYIPPSIDKENIFEANKKGGDALPLEENRKRKNKNQSRSNLPKGVFIFDENSSISKMNNTDSDQLTFKGTDRETTKKRILTDLNLNRIAHSERNAINNSDHGLKIIQIQPEEVTEQKVNKISISNDEKMMNGAPDGDLYELVVLQDDELKPFEDSNSVEKEFLSSISKHSASTIWAEKYEQVAVLRRILIHHVDVLASVDLTYICSAVDMIIESTTSLRSCVIRNGLLAMRRFLRYFNTLVDSNESGELAIKIIAALLNRTLSGPKFICEIANDILSIAAADKQIPALNFFKGLLPFASHRSPEVSSKAIILSTRCLQGADAHSNVLSSPGGSNVLYKDALKIAVNGLTTRLAKGREAAKEAIKLLLNRMTSQPFREFVSKVLSPGDAAEVLRLLDTDKSFIGGPNSSNNNNNNSSSHSTGSNNSSSNIRKFRPPAAVPVSNPPTNPNPPIAHVFPKVSNMSNARLSADKVCCGNITPKKKGLVTAAHHLEECQGDGSLFIEPSSNSISHSNNRTSRGGNMEVAARPTPPSNSKGRRVQIAQQVSQSQSQSNGEVDSSYQIAIGSPTVTASGRKGKILNGSNLTSPKGGNRDV